MNYYNIILRQIKNFSNNFKQKREKYKAQIYKRSILIITDKIITRNCGVFWLKSEPFLMKIRTLTFSCRPVGDNPAQRFRSPDGKQNRKIFFIFLFVHL